MSLTTEIAEGQLVFVGFFTCDDTDAREFVVIADPHGEEPTVLTRHALTPATWMTKGGAA